MNRQEHLLVIAAEECAEIQHAIAKALRFGLEGTGPITNAQQIHKEFNDLLAVLRMLRGTGVSIFADGHLVQDKMDKVEHYLLDSEQRGTLDK